MDIRGVHYDVSERTREFIGDKMKHLDHFADLVQSHEVVIHKDANEFKVDLNTHLRTGQTHHLQEKDLELYPAIERLIHNAKVKLGKEKEKIKSHH